MGFYATYLHIYKLNWARRTSRGWRDERDDTALQTTDLHYTLLFLAQDTGFDIRILWSEAELATSRSRMLPTILIHYE